MPEGARGVFAERILMWYAANGRPYPWRATMDPYAILVAEVMLQRTGAAKVEKVYRVFVERYPTIQHAATAQPSDLLHIIRPLGLVKRAQLMHELFTEIVSRYGGTVPDDLRVLTALPGLGLYTARALLCFAYGKDHGLLDSNVARVFARAFNVRASKRLPQRDPNLWLFADALVPQKRGRDFNYGLLDLAAMVCVAGVPRCRCCPIDDICQARIMGAIHGLPPR